MIRKQQQSNNNDDNDKDDFNDDDDDDDDDDDNDGDENDGNETNRAVSIEVVQHGNTSLIMLSLNLTKNALIGNAQN